MCSDDDQIAGDVSDEQRSQSEEADHVCASRHDAEYDREQLQPE
jgi:hypothetical protein